MSHNPTRDEFTYQLVDRSVNTIQDINRKFIICHQCECVLMVSNCSNLELNYVSIVNGKPMYEVIPITCASCPHDMPKNSFLPSMSSSSTVFISGILKGRAASIIRTLYNCDLYCKHTETCDDICNLISYWDIVAYVAKYNTTEYPIQCNQHRLHYTK